MDRRAKEKVNGFCLNRPEAVLKLADKPVVLTLAKEVLALLQKGCASLKT